MVSMDGMVFYICVGTSINECTRYPYPIFHVLNTWQRAALFGSSAFVMTGSTMGLKWIYGKINGVEKFKREAVSKPAGIKGA